MVLRVCYSFSMVFRVEYPSWLCTSGWVSLVMYLRVCVPRVVPQGSVVNLPWWVNASLPWWVNASLPWWVSVILPWWVSVILPWWVFPPAHGGCFPSCSWWVLPSCSWWVIPVLHIVGYSRWATVVVIPVEQQWEGSPPWALCGEKKRVLIMRRRHFLVAHGANNSAHTARLLSHPRSLPAWSLLFSHSWYSRDVRTVQH